MADHEAVRKQTHDAVVARPFTRIAGLPTWEEKENFLEEASTLAMCFIVAYDWAGDHGLLAEIVGKVKYLALTTKNYVEPKRPPIVPAGYANLTEKNARTATIKNTQDKIDFAVLEGFRSGFGEIYRKAFDPNYYEQLWEEVFHYRRVTPRMYIEHLETRWCKMDTLVIGRLRARFLRGWDPEEHIVTFRVRMERERKKLKQYDPPIVFTDDEICQHYMEQMLKNLDTFGQKNIKK